MKSGTPRIPEQSRSYPDWWGSNTPLIQGFNAYDNSGPQYSRNNTFYNFTTTSYRNAGAIGPLVGGSFILRTLNRYANNTIINSNLISMTYDSDTQTSWATLDLDGTVTGVTGGGWIMSNTSLLLNPSCSYNSSWNAYFCPPSESSYLQLELDDWTGIPNNTDIDGITYTYPGGTKVWYGKYFQLGDSSKWASLYGHIIDCSLGVSMCWSYITNLVARRGYTIRFGINDHLKGIKSSS